MTTESSECNPIEARYQLFLDSDLQKSFSKVTGNLSLYTGASTDRDLKNDQSISNSSRVLVGLWRDDPKFIQSTHEYRSDSLRRTETSLLFYKDGVFPELRLLVQSGGRKDTDIEKDKRELNITVNEGEGSRFPSAIYYCEEDGNYEFDWSITVDRLRADFEMFPNIIMPNGQNVQSIGSDRFSIKRVKGLKGVVKSMTVPAKIRAEKVKLFIEDIGGEDINDPTLPILRVLQMLKVKIHH